MGKASKKYELTSETKTIDGHILHRIRALKNINFTKSHMGNKYTIKIKQGETGGFVESEDNLTQAGNSWSVDNACAYQNAKIADNACLTNNARAFGNSVISSYARISDNAQAYDNSRIRGNSFICKHAQIHQNAVIEHGQISDYAQIHGNAIINCEYGQIGGHCDISGNTIITDNINLKGNVIIKGSDVENYSETANPEIVRQINNIIKKNSF